MPSIDFLVMAMRAYFYDCGKSLRKTELRKIDSRSSTQDIIILAQGSN